MIPFLLGCVVGGTVGLLTAAFCRAAADDPPVNVDVHITATDLSPDAERALHNAMAAVYRTQPHRLPREVMG